MDQPQTDVTTLDERVCDLEVEPAPVVAPFVIVIAHAVTRVAASAQNVPETEGDFERNVDSGR